MQNHTLNFLPNPSRKWWTELSPMASSPSHAFFGLVNVFSPWHIASQHPLLFGLFIAWGIHIEISYVHDLGRQGAHSGGWSTCCSGRKQTSKKSSWTMTIASEHVHSRRGTEKYRLTRGRLCRNSRRILCQNSLESSNCCKKISTRILWPTLYNQWFSSNNHWVSFQQTQLRTYIVVFGLILSVTTANSLIAYMA